MTTLLTFLVWVMVFLVCWPLAVLALLLFPFVWLLLLPFRLTWIAVEALVALFRAILFLPSRLLGGRSAP